MSNDKKRDRALQRRVRERQAKTGEGYQAAWRKLTNSNEPERVADVEPAADTTVPVSPLYLRRILPLTLPQGQRVPPHQPLRITAQAKEAIDIAQILISNAGTEGGAADWIVNDIEVDGRSQLAMKNLSGAVFGRGIASNQKASTSLSIQGFDPIEYGHEFAITVTYIGPNPEGVPFFGVVAGFPPPQRPTVVPIMSKAPLLPTIKTTITARVQNAPFQMQRLEIADSATDCASDWFVDDLRINGRSQFTQQGSIPGEVFSARALNTFTKLEDCRAGNAIEIDVIYIGPNAHGACFTAHLEGTVLRDNYNTAPPDLRVLVETSGQGTGTAAVGICNWRAPAMDNRTH